MTNQRPYIILGAFFLTVLAVPIGVIWPSIKTISSTANAIYQEYEFLESKSQRGHDIRKARTEFEELKINVTELRRLALEPGAELEFITSVEELAATHDVEETLNLRVDNIKKNGPYQEIPFQLTIRGPYTSTLQYLAALRTLPMVTTFSEVAISRLVSTGRQINLNAGASVQVQLTGTVYQHLSSHPLSGTAEKTD